MRQGRKIFSVTAIAVASAALAVGIAGAASASESMPHSAGGYGTENCADGIYAGYCGTQVSGNDLYIAVGFGGQVIGTTSPRADNAEFIWFADQSSAAANNDKYAEFAPNGIASNKVMADVNHHIVLATASGAADQKWVYNGTGWTNVGTGDVLKSTYNGGPIVAASTQSVDPSETWTFVTP
jgi:hypothetical protein